MSSKDGFSISSGSTLHKNVTFTASNTKKSAADISQSFVKTEKSNDQMKESSFDPSTSFKIRKTKNAD